MERKQLCSLAFFPAVVIYLELITKFLCFGDVTIKGSALTILFSLAAGALFIGICSLFGDKAFMKAMFTLTAILCLVFAVQNVYFSIFGTFLSLDSTTELKGVLNDFWRQALEGIISAWREIAVSFLPLIILILFRKHFQPVYGKKLSLRIFTACLLLHIGALCCVFIPSDSVMSTKYLYTGGFMPELSVRTFGVVTTERLDIRQLISPAQTIDLSAEITEPAPEYSSSLVPTSSPELGTEETPEPTPVVYHPNVLDIDFAALAENETNETLKKMHSHFASVEPTMQNEYTGMFEGKNLIWIVGESFSTAALDETHTPTLYKLAQSGFVFNNFYNPGWHISTSDGEYVTLTGLLPKSGVWSFTRSADNDMSMTMGHMLGALGYDCNAYHNHTYTYYNRHRSHPNMGYDYKGVGNGLEITDHWPGSDLEMVRNSVSEFINADKFHTYYLTVSGHMNYTFNGNMQAYRHIEDVADLPYSSNCRAYIACNMELDLAVEYLINELEKAGRLEDTVIVLSGDHYPYGLTEAEIEEILGYDLDSNFEIYHSSLMIWSGDMKEPIEINKPCASVDILPTLANLFGLPYDSRLLAGRDILSDSEGLVIFANRSFISEYGRYDSTRDKFIPNEGAVVPESYARDILYGRVSDAFSYSAAILDNDYYSVVLPKGNNDTVK